MALLREDVARFEKAVTEGVAPVVLTQNQFDACVCLAFNIGEKGFKSSSLVKAIKADLASPSEVRRLFGLWDKAGGKVNKGLVTRRASEATMFNRDS
jgi:lysozyme